MGNAGPQTVARCCAALLALTAWAALAQEELGGSAVPARAAPLAPSAAAVPSSPLAEAAARSEMTRVRTLLSAGGVDANAPDRDGTPALHWVTRVGDIET